jgi:hypothetical protein
VRVSERVREPEPILKTWKCFQVDNTIVLSASSLVCSNVATLTLHAAAATIHTTYLIESRSFVHVIHAECEKEERKQRFAKCKQTLF